MPSYGKKEKNQKGSKQRKGGIRVFKMLFVVFPFPEALVKTLVKNLVNTLSSGHRVRLADNRCDDAYRHQHVRDEH